MQSQAVSYDRVRRDCFDYREKLAFFLPTLTCLSSQAERKFHDLSAMWKDGGILSVDNQCQPRGAVNKPVIPPISFEVSRGFAIFFVLSPPTVSANALFSGCPYTAFVRLFISTDFITTTSHEWLEQL